MNIDFGGGGVVSGDESHLKAMWEGQSNVVVAVRVRPLMKHDLVKKNCVRVLDGKVVVLMDPTQDKQDVLRVNRSREKQYAFDFAFDGNSSQEEVYNRTTKFLIHGVLDGYNATVFAYGQTGSGKTHTMIGSPSDNGIMVRVMEDLFAYSNSVGSQQRVNYKVTVSFLEVYNENIRDLLSDVEEYLDLREDPIKGPVVAGITEVEAKSSVEIMQLLHQGNARRSQAATAANEVSSRSHAVLQVVVENIDKAPGIVANIKVGKLSLVDLAGSERAANTKNSGVRLVEGANINRSLLALGNCINALGEKGNKGNFVPYRDSKLTRLLKDSLGGNCRTVMIAAISCAESSFEETQNTLKYANRAKNIKTNAQRNVLNVNYHISEYVQLITNLRSEIKMLKDQLVHNDPDGGGSPNKDVDGIPIVRKVSVDGIHEHQGHSEPLKLLPLSGNSINQHRAPTTPLEILRESMRIGGDGRTLVNQMRDQIVENFQEKMQLRRSLIELEDQNVQNSIEISKRQLLVVHWSEGHGFCPFKTNGFSSENKSELSEEVIDNAPDDIKTAWHDCEQLKKAVMKNNAMKKNIAKRLRHNEKESERLREEMTTKVTGEDRRELMELQYQVGRLELENMELEQHRIVHESILKGKDLTIQKLQLQLAVRDKLIVRQQKILMDHDLDHKVGYSQLAQWEQSVMGDHSLDDIAPPSPLRDLDDQNHHERAVTNKKSKGKSKLDPSIADAINKELTEINSQANKLRQDERKGQGYDDVSHSFHDYNDDGGGNDSNDEMSAPIHNDNHSMNMLSPPSHQPLNKSPRAQVPSSNETKKKVKTFRKFNKIASSNEANTSSSGNNPSNANISSQIAPSLNFGVQGNGFGAIQPMKIHIHSGGVRNTRQYRPINPDNSIQEGAMDENSSIRGPLKSNSIHPSRPNVVLSNITKPTNNIITSNVFVPSMNGIAGSSLNIPAMSPLGPIIPLEKPYLAPISQIPHTLPASAGKVLNEDSSDDDEDNLTARSDTHAHSADGKNKRIPSIAMVHPMTDDADLPSQDKGFGHNKLNMNAKSDWAQGLIVSPVNASAGHGFSSDNHKLSRKPHGNDHLNNNTHGSSDSVEDEYDDEIFEESSMSEAVNSDPTNAGSPTTRKVPLAPISELIVINNDVGGNSKFASKNNANKAVNFAVNGSGYQNSSITAISQNVISKQNKLNSNANNMNIGNNLSSLSVVGESNLAPITSGPGRFALPQRTNKPVAAFRMNKVGSGNNSNGINAGVGGLGSPVLGSPNLNVNSVPSPTGHNRLRH